MLLTPAQSRTWLGGEILVVSCALLAIIVGSHVSPRARQATALRYLVVALALVLVPDLALVIGGVSVLAGAGGGLYWVMAGMALGFFGAVTNAWVLLVEIQR